MGRQVIDIRKDGEKVYVKNHAKVTFLSDGTNVEQRIIDVSNDLSTKVNKDYIDDILENIIIDSSQIDFNQLKNNPFVDNNSGKLEVTDESGNIIAKIDVDGIHSVDFITGEHRLSDKTDKTYVDEAVKNVKVDLTRYATEEYVNNIDFYNIKDNPIVNNGDGKLLFVDENGYIGLQLEEDGLYVKDVIADGHTLSQKADKSELSNYATKDEVSDLVDMSVVTELQGKVDTLVGEDADKSVRDIAVDVLTETLVSETATEAYDTLAEMSAWIKSHPEDASAMNTAIQKNATDITNLDAAYKAADTKVLTDAQEYTDNINFYTIKDNPIVDGEAGSITFVDETGYIGLKVTEDGIVAKDVVTPEHTLSSKADKSFVEDNYYNKSTVDKKIAEAVTGGQVSLDGFATEEWVNNKNYATEYDLKTIDFSSINNVPLNEDASGEFSIVDESGNVGMKVSSDAVYAKDFISGEHKLSEKASKSDIPTKLSQLENDINITDKTISDGVYAVNTNGELINYSTADENCIGVVLVAGEHKFMIAKSDATNDGSNYNLYYDYDKGDLSLTNYSNADGTNSYGYLGGSSTPQLSQDFTTWTAGALSDFNGKTNTEVIAASSSNAKDMCKVLETFNAGSDNQGHTDWYVPACGQLALMYLAKTDINAALAKIGGTALESDYYWSSSENGSSYAWNVNFDNGNVSYGRSKSNFYRVRFVRDISVKPLRERVSDLENKLSNKQNTLVSGTNIKTINGQSLLGGGNITISEGGGSSSGGGGAYAEVNHGTGDTTFVLTPNTFHVWDEVASLDLSFGDEQDGVANEYLFQFTSGSTATTLTLPDNIKWANGLVITANRIYQISVLKGLASVLEFVNESKNTPIVFYVNDVEYNAIEGMTWREWVDSEYNTANAIITGEFVYINNMTVFDNSIPNYVNSNGHIENEYRYTLRP